MQPDRQMKRIAKYALLVVSTLTLSAAENTPAPPRFETAVVERIQRILPRNALSNQGIVMLSAAGYDEDFLIDLIRLKQTRFDTTVEGLMLLANQGVSERVIRCMLANENKPASSTVNVPVATAPAAVRMKVVRQMVLAPDVKAMPQFMAGTAPMAGTQVQAAGVPAMYQYGALAAGPYLVKTHDLFGNRWYVVNPDYQAPAPALSLPISGTVPIRASSRWKHFPPW